MAPSMYAQRRIHRHHIHPRRKVILTIGHIHASIMLDHVLLHTRMSTHLFHALVRMGIHHLHMIPAIRTRTHTHTRTPNLMRRVPSIHEPRGRHRKLLKLGARSSGSFGTNGREGRGSPVSPVVAPSVKIRRHPALIQGVPDQMADGAKIGLPRVVPVLPDRIVDGVTVRDMPMVIMTILVTIRTKNGLGNTDGLGRTYRCVHPLGLPLRLDFLKLLPRIPKFGILYSLPTIPSI